MQPSNRAIEPEFALARELIRTRTAAGVAQEDVNRMGTKQSLVAQLEVGRAKPHFDHAELGCDTEA